MPSLHRRLAGPTSLAALIFALSACTVVVEEPGPIPIDPGPRICTREYAPVCATRGGDRQTFSNPCLADQAGYRIVDRGECRRRPPRPPVEEPRFCTREYAPVCGRRGSDIRTFGNACEARASDYRIIDRGPC
ncbi:MAG: peptidase [Mesorhizobium amorphae]|nr:MAG: peptidase [Mesorhizobium amorphae]